MNGKVDELFFGTASIWLLIGQRRLGKRKKKNKKNHRRHRQAIEGSKFRDFLCCSSLRRVGLRLRKTRTVGGGGKNMTGHTERDTQREREREREQ